MSSPARARHLATPLHLLCILLALGACGDDGGGTAPGADGEPVPTRVVITTSSPLRTGDTATYRAVAQDARGTRLEDVAITWSSSADSVVSVTGDGRVMGRHRGRAQIIARAGELADTVVVEVPPGWAQVDAGWDFACALDDTGAPWCWGINGGGQLGVSGVQVSRVPLRIPGTLRFASIHAGRSAACGLTREGEAWCWGTLEEGSAGGPAFTPTRLPGDARWRDISLGRWNACGATTAGALRCWGLDFGATPVAHGVARDYADVGMNERSGCARTTGGEMYCWGYAFTTGSVTQTQPTRSFDAWTFAQIGVGTAHSCGRTSSGQVACAGEHGSYGSVGTSSTEEWITTPVTIALGESAAVLESDNRGNCLATRVGDVWCWGAFIVTSRTPWQVSGLARARALAMGNGTAYAITHGAALFAWGANDGGQLGDGTLQRRNTPGLIAYAQ